MKNLLLMIGILTTVHASAQNISVQGTVLDDQSQPVSGADISEEAKGSHVVSDAQGHFTITVNNGKARLLISYVGKQTQTVAINNQSNIRIVLLPGAGANLNEVVVTAMGIKRADRNIGYSVSTVKGAELTKAREPSALAGLVGKVSGLSVGPSAEMVGRPQVVLRGNKDIMYVVDGVPVNSDGWNLSPDDIESYTILKGPNAAALYGFRGQNGAIVITTKRGSRNARGWEINFNSSDMLESGFLARPHAQTEYGRGTGFVYSFGDRLYDNAQRLPIWGPHIEGQLVKQYDSPYDPVTGVRTATPYTVKNTDNLSSFLQTGILSTNNISASASGENYDIRMSYSHTYQKGQIPNTKLNIDNLNVMANYRFSKKLSLEANLNFNEQYTPNIPDVSYGPNSVVYEFGVYGNAAYDVKDLKDYWKGPSGVEGLMQYSENYGRDNNPYFQANNWLRGHYKTDVYGYIKLNYKFNDDLDVSIRSQVSTWNQDRTEKVPVSAVLNSYLPSGTWYTFGQYNGDFRQDKRNSLENNSDLIVNYNKNLDNGLKIHALAGGGWRSFKYTSSWATTRNLSIPGVYTFQNSKTTATLYNFSSNMMVYSGFYSVDLGYKKYFNVSTTGRVDDLSTLPSGNRTFFYPSVSLSSILSDYVKLPDVISSLKVRGSWAAVKSALTQATIPSAYYMATGQTTGSVSMLGYGDELYSSYDGPSYANQGGYSLTTYYNNTPSVNKPTYIPNPTLKPANNGSYEGGLDLRLLNNRIGVSATYFVSDAGPQIYAKPVDPATGYNTINVNGVTTQKKGWELQLTGSPLRNPNGLNWDITVNWSTYIERLKEVYGDENTLTINGHTYGVGDRMDAYYGNGFVRNTSGQILYSSSGIPIQNPNTGLSGRKFLGYMNPDYSFGINNSFSYKSFNFSFQFDGRVGGKIYDRVWQQMYNAGTAPESVEGALGAARQKEWQSYSTGGTTVPAYVGDGVVPNSTAGMVIVDGVVTNSASYTFTPNTTATTVQTYMSSGVGAGGATNMDEYFMVSRSYAKLREVTLGYTFPASVLKNGFVKGLSVSLVGRNLLYFAARKDFDIDQYASGYNFADNSLTGTSSTNLQSPTARRYGININVNF